MQTDDAPRPTANCGLRKRDNLRGGSRLGKPNKISQSIKIEVLESFRMVGGREYLARQAIENPTAYMGLLGKVIPQQVQSELTPLRVVVQQLNVVPQPIPGVLSSPIKGHVCLPSV